MKIRCYSISYPQLEMWPTQSWAVTDEIISARGIDDVSNTLLFCFRTLLTWLNTPSAGFRSGEYGGIKTQVCSRLIFDKINHFLHMVVTGVIHSNYRLWVDTVKRTSLTNLVKRLPFIVPSVMSTS